MSPKQQNTGKRSKPGKAGGKRGGTGQRPAFDEAQRAHRPDEGEVFAVITKILGGNHIEAISDDGHRRIIRIPGKIRRRQWVRTGDLILVEPWYGLDQNEKGDLKYRYQKNEYRSLFKNETYRAKLEKLGIEKPKQVHIDVFADQSLNTDQ